MIRYTKSISDEITREIVKRREWASGGFGDGGRGVDVCALAICALYNAEKGAGATSDQRGLDKHYCQH